MSAPLTIERFPEFFEAVHGFAPYPWQERLATAVIGEGRWPDVLSLPTGSGKTAALSIATYALAVDARREPAARTCPRRILMIVDRRVVVDQSAMHAELIARHLAEGGAGILDEVAGALSGLHGEQRPIGVAVLRGGIPRDDAWARTPDQPLLAVSTVDQVGSRLLFRGYGVSKGMRPVHAGLLGNDALLLLDEVHLSRPFARTLADLEDVLRDARLRSLPRRWQVVHLSATAGQGYPGQRFELAPADRDHPVLGPRLAARRELSAGKPIKVPARGSTSAVAEKVGRAVAAEARKLLNDGRRRIAVIVNRVAAALAARAALDDVFPAVDVELLTGRMRPLDKDAVVNRLLGRVGAGVPHDPDAAPVVVVATQCLEAGADLDFDAMVTECASADALVQRLGRLNRRGLLDTAPAVVVIRSDQCTDKAAADPIYGAAIANTWQAVSSLSVVTEEGLQSLLAESSCLAPAADAPALLPAHLEAWARTSPAPDPDPETALWLHGPEVSLPEVRLVWRADLPRELTDGGESVSERWLTQLFGACPPSTLEAIEVPIWAARQFLQAEGENAADLADVERRTETSNNHSDAVPAESGSKVVRWDGSSASLASASDLKPGDTLVVPAQVGGLRWSCWDPSAREPVVDLGDLANWRHRGRPTLRVHGESIGGHQPPSLDVEDEAADVVGVLTDWLMELELSGEFASLRKALGRRPRSQLLLGGPGPMVVFLGPRTRVDRPTITSEEDTASFIEKGVPLPVHLAHVRDRAREFAARLGLPPETAKDVALAAWLHDVGKADARFQVVLGGGMGAPGREGEMLLAKSPVAVENVDRRTRAWEASGLPRGFRHELVSLALLDGNPDIREQAHDIDLVLHLVASHHGWCRPFAPPVLDPDAGEVRVKLGELGLRTDGCTQPGHLSTGVAERFSRVQERYGWHGLAWLESIVRLADHRASEAEALA